MYESWIGSNKNKIKKVSRYNDKGSRYYEKDSRYNEKVSSYYKKLSKIVGGWVSE